MKLATTKMKDHLIFLSWTELFDKTRQRRHWSTHSKEAPRGVVGADLPYPYHWIR
jgi:hypothetical protein